MNKSILMIILIATSWHIGLILVVEKIKDNHRDLSFKEILKVIEIDLLKKIRKKIDNMTEEDVEFPSHEWKKESEYWIKRIRNQNE